MLSQKYDKDRKVQHKKRKTTLPKIAFPDMMDTCEEYDKNKKYDKEKEAECPYETSIVDTEEGVNDINDDSNEKMMKKKRQNAMVTIPLLLLRKV